ncbi:hypothetical protein FGADI_13545 [Fusarium gaditjirri]|uniref:Ankyrin n=1 Tax=Fusarium gaditjirri TaxID=282569 RepID=A0A8H4WMQ9_9HYPO|nr:hypothetical protein FGADI_13545 [Fusarium gaditjirri]
MSIYSEENAERELDKSTGKLLELGDGDESKPGSSNLAERGAMNRPKPRTRSAFPSFPGNHGLGIRQRTRQQVFDPKINYLHELLLEVKETPYLNSAAQRFRHRLRDLSNSHVNIEDSRGRTLLHTAAERGLSKMTKLLLRKDANIEARTAEGATPLLLACEGGDLSTVKVLLGQSANCQVLGPRNETPLMMASKYGHEDIVEMLLRGGNASPDILNATNSKHGATALHLAAFNGHRNIVTHLLHNNAQFGIQDKEGRTPLMLATQEGHEGVLRELLGGGTDKNNLQLEKQDSSGCSPLLQASMDGFVAGAQLLISFHANVNACSEATEGSPLMAAISRGCRDIVEALCKSGRVEIDATTVLGRSALHLAASLGDTEIVSLLLCEGAKINLRDCNDHQPLHLASLFGCKKTVEILLQNGAEINAADCAGATPLHLASLELGDDSAFNYPEYEDTETYGQRLSTPTPYEPHDVIKLLLNTGTDSNNKADSRAKTKRGETALHFAAKGGDGSKISLLLNSMNVEDVEALTKDGNSVFDNAIGGMSELEALESLFNSPKTTKVQFKSPERQKLALLLLADCAAAHEAVRLFMFNRSDPIDPAKTKWTAIDWAADQKSPDLLWLLIANSRPDIVEDGTLKSALKRVNRAEDTATTNLIIRILESPPIAMRYVNQKTYNIPSLPREDELLKQLEMFDSTIVWFLETRGCSNSISKVTTVRDAIYTKGPQKIISDSVDLTLNMEAFSDDLYLGDISHLTQPRSLRRVDRGQTLQKAYEGHPVHLSSTLDEWYHHFGTDDGSVKDRDRRNKTQVATRCLLGTDNVDGQDSWPVIEVNQLWIWTIHNKWIITACPSSIDGSGSTLVAEVRSHLCKQVEAGGEEGLPETATDLARCIIDYCIGSYERQQKAIPQEHSPDWTSNMSIRQTFSKSLSGLGREEFSLFEKFRRQLENEEDDWKSQQSSKEAIIKAQKLSSYMRDIRDELAILKSVAKYQESIQKGLVDDRMRRAGLTASHVVNDIEEMEGLANRLQSAANTSLSLQQSEIANRQAQQSVKQGQESIAQGRTLMVFTVVTSLFLPMSFLSSMFAMDVASFKQSPWWSFVIMCMVPSPAANVLRTKLRIQVIVSFLVFLPLSIWLMTSKTFYQWLDESYQRLDEWRKRCRHGINDKPSAEETALRHQTEESRLANVRQSENGGPPVTMRKRNSSLKQGNSPLLTGHASTPLRDHLNISQHAETGESSTQRQLLQSERDLEKGKES